MITSGAVSAPLLPHHQRVKPQTRRRHAAVDDFAGALSWARPTMVGVDLSDHRFLGAAG